jgi:hypothetical protein
MPQSASARMMYGMKKTKMSKGKPTAKKVVKKTVKKIAKKKGKK